MDEKEETMSKLKWERLPDTGSKEQHEGIRTDDGRYSIVTTMLSREDQDRGLRCSLLVKSRWLRDFASQIEAKRWAEQMESTTGGAL